MTPTTLPALLKDEALPPSARQRRKLAKHMAAVQRWWESLPDTEKGRPFFRSAELLRGSGLTSVQLGPALRALGWRYAQRRLPELMNLPAAVWAPPWQPDPRRRHGRPAKPTPADEQPWGIDL